MKRILTYLGLLPLLTGCGFEKLPSAVLATESGSFGLNAFKVTTYQLVHRDCVSCHGSGIGPQFAAPNLSASYTIARSYANFADIPSSRFVVKSTDSHCGAHCQTDGTEMIASLQAWWDQGESQMGGVYQEPNTLNVILAALPVPATLPTGTLFTTLNWDLAAVSPTLAGVRFTIELQDFSPEAYRFRNPRIITNAGLPVTVKNVKILFNGEFEVHNSGYTTIDRVVPAPSNTILSTYNMISLKELGPGADLLSIGFEILSRP